MRVEVTVSINLLSSIDDDVLGKMIHKAVDRLALGETKFKSVNHVHSSLQEARAAAGYARAASLTSHERKVIAQKAARTRWAKHRGKKA